jgi:hypothetical protein
MPVPVLQIMPATTLLLRLMPVPVTLLLTLMLVASKQLKRPKIQANITGQVSLME